MDIEHRSASLAQALFFKALEPSRQPKFSVSLVTTGWGTPLALTHVATDSFSYVCSQNLHLASFPQVPAGHEPHTDDPSRSSRMLQCSHTRLPSRFLYHFLPFQAWQGIQETISIRGNPRAEALGSWVWILGLETGSARTGQQYPQGPQQPSDPQL